MNKNLQILSGTKPLPLVIFFTGKGGVGKSLSSLSCAKSLAALGARVCLVESVRKSRLQWYVGQEIPLHTFVKIQPNIDVFNIDPTKNFSDFLQHQFGMGSLIQSVFNSPMVKSFTEVLPGLAELCLLGRIRHLAQGSGLYDYVVVDGFASGHFVQLVRTPQAILRSGIPGKVRTETQALVDFYKSDENSGVMLVTAYETLMIAETKEAAPNINKEIPMFGVVLNYVYPHLPTQEDEFVLRDKVLAHKDLGSIYRFAAKTRSQDLSAKESIQKMCKELSLQHYILNKVEDFDELTQNWLLHLRAGETAQ